MPAAKGSTRRRAKRLDRVKVVDLFCGIGGLSHGLWLEGFDIEAGVDSDLSCKFSYEKNNKARFVHKPIQNLSAGELEAMFDGASIRVLVGCAPCQPYSSLVRDKMSHAEIIARWKPLYRFIELIEATQPEIVSMENVPELCKVEKFRVFEDFLTSLKRMNYFVSYQIVDASRYGVPQKRNRMVLLASKLGGIELAQATHSAETALTVRDAIFDLSELSAGKISKFDPLHRASKLSDLNLARISATPKDGGSASSWPDNLLPTCYRRKSGRTYMVTVYGRMKWDAPAPTMTTQCTTLGTGRFGHPNQNRAISLREAARFQTFPDYYDFGQDINIHASIIAKQIGNAVPVTLGRVIGRSIKQHLKKVAR